MNTHISQSDDVKSKSRKQSAEYNINIVSNRDSIV